jgi:hypothetical protein
VRTPTTQQHVCYEPLIMPESLRGEHRGVQSAATTSKHITDIKEQQVTPAQGSQSQMPATCRVAKGVPVYAAILVLLLLTCTA